MSFEIRVSEDNIGRLKQAVEEAAERGLEMCGQKARDYASMLAPVDTGRLAGSMESVVQEQAVYIGTNVEYAAYQEFGTSKMHAANDGRGFLRPALNDHIPEYQTILESALSNLIF